MNAQLGSNRGAVFDRVDAHVCLWRDPVGGCAGDNNLLDKPQLEGSNWIEAVHEIVWMPMRGRIAQSAQGVQRLDRFLRSLGVVDGLRFIDYYDRSGGLYVLDWLPAGETVALLIHDVAFALVIGAHEILAKRIIIDDRNLDCIRGCELAQEVHSLGVVHKILEWGIVVEYTAMFRRDLEVLQHALADRNTRHYDHELG